MGEATFQDASLAPFTAPGSPPTRCRAGFVLDRVSALARWDARTNSWPFVWEASWVNDHLL